MPTGAPSDALVIGNGDTETASVEYFERIVWETTGQLVLDDGAGLGLTEDSQ